MAAAAALLLGSPAAFVAPGSRAWSPAFLSSGPGDQLRVLGVQRQRPPCQALVQWQGPCQAPVGRRPRARDVKRHAVVLACDRKVEEEERQTSLEVVQAVLRAVVSVIFVLACADTCTSRGLPTVRTGYACQPPAHLPARSARQLTPGSPGIVRAHYACQPWACVPCDRFFSGHPSGALQRRRKGCDGCLRRHPAAQCMRFRPPLGTRAAVRRGAP
jgi:hypothetical protein